MTSGSLEDKQALLRTAIPDFAGYGLHHYLRTDYLFRGHLAAELEKVRDRLADLLAGAAQPPPEKSAACLQHLAALKERLAPKVEPAPPEVLAARNQEQVVDLDLALLEKVAGLHSPLDRLEKSFPTKAESATDLLHEGLTEVEELFEKRRKFLAEE